MKNFRESLIHRFGMTPPPQKCPRIKTYGNNSLGKGRVHSISVRLNSPLSTSTEPYKKERLRSDRIMIPMSFAPRGFASFVDSPILKIESVAKEPIPECISA